MADRAGKHRFYGDLARWWPLISPPEDYAEEAAFAASVIRTASIPVRDVLELGSGGGHSTVDVVHETHRLGLFWRDDWLRLLADAGFDPEVVTEVTSEDRAPRLLFVEHRPMHPRTDRGRPLP